MRAFPLPAGPSQHFSVPTHQGPDCVSQQSPGEAYDAGEIIPGWPHPGVHMGQCDCSLAVQFPGSNSAHMRVFDGVWGREGGEMESGELEDLGRWLLVKRRVLLLRNQGRLDSHPSPPTASDLSRGRGLDKLDVLCKVSSRAWHSQRALDGSVSLFGAARANVRAEHLRETRVEYPGAALKDRPP